MDCKSPDEQPCSKEIAADHHNLFRLFPMGYLCLIVVTWPLWMPQTVFPEVPVISIARKLPHSFELGLLVVLLVSLVILLSFERSRVRRWTCLTTAVSTLGLICIDQHRLQPWVWQFLILSLVFVAAEASKVRRIWQWLVIGIYAWSAWSKLDRGFCTQHGQFLLEGFFKSVGMTNLTRFWPENVRTGLAGLIPVLELLIAGGLCWRATQRVALFGAAFMHAGLLLALGPLGHNHQLGVLVWNLFFLVQNWLLFFRVKPATPHDISTNNAARSIGPTSSDRSQRIGNSLAIVIVASALIWPVLEPFGHCDHWIAWAVYATKPERVTVLLFEEELVKLPKRLTPYVGPQTLSDRWYPLRLDRWSLDAVYAPIYPQDRFQVGVTLALIRDLDLKQIRLVIEGPANWWTGKRSMREYLTVESVETLADSYRCGARPR